MYRKTSLFFYKINMKKIIILYTFTIFLLPFQSLCEQTPAICNSTPDQLRWYFSTIISVINQIKNNTTPNTTNQSSWFWALWEKLLQTWVWSITLLSTFWVNWFFHNFFASFIIIFHQQYIVRDWTQLINFKKYIGKAFLDIASKWILEKKIPQEKINQLKQTIENNPYFLHYLDTNTLTYKRFFQYIRDNQQDIESIYLLVTTNMEKLPPLTTHFPINKNHLNAIKTNFMQVYLDSSGKEYKCDLDIHKALKKIKEIINLSKKSKNAISRFKCNYNRLKNVLFWTPFYWNCGSVRLVEWWHIWVKWQIKVEWAWKILVNAITNDWKKVFDTSWFKPNFSFFKKLWSNIKKAIPFNYKTWTISIATYQKEQFIKEISTITKNIKNQKSQASNILLYVSPKFTENLTPQFPVLSEKIWIWICTIDSEYFWCDNLTDNKYPDKWIYQNLVETCENQSPFIGKCRY